MSRGHCHKLLQGDVLQAESVIAEHIPRVAPARTNIIADNGALCCTTMGGYTQRGQGITQAAYRHPRILSAVHALATTRENQMAEPYLAVSITSGRTPWHTDQNEGWTSLTAVGSFKGGQIVIQLPDGN
eukprot:6237240-Amphidinium_carterae.1